jgi:hypothetical protein
MRKMLKLSIAAAMVMGIGSVSAQADGIDIVSNVKAKGEIRARYENVDASDNGKADANAFTNRLTIGVGADLLDTDWLSAYVEMTDVRSGNDNFNSGVNGQTGHQTVADSDQTRVTQAYVDAKYGNTNLRFGRQMINLDNQRFVGAVGWRQMFQTFDAVTLTNTDVENLKLFASYVTQRNTIANEGTDDGRDLLLNASYKVMPELKVTAYGYLLGGATAATGHDTYGLALTGKIGVADGVSVSYRAEYATQTDPSMEDSGTDNSAVNVDADYMNFELGVNANGILAGVGYEVLSGDDGSTDSTAFKTPYATLHGKNGWADVFLPGGGSPIGGLEDLSLYVGYKSKDLGLLKVVYHDFKADEKQGVQNEDYGTEIDVVYKRAIPGVNGLTGMVKYASFDAEKGTSAYQTDVEKLWLMLTYKFASN